MAFTQEQLTKLKQDYTSPEFQRLPFDTKKKKREELESFITSEIKSEFNEDDPKLDIYVNKVKDNIEQNFPSPKNEFIAKATEGLRTFGGGVAEEIGRTGDTVYNLGSLAVNKLTKDKNPPQTINNAEKFRRAIVSDEVAEAHPYQKFAGNIGGFIGTSAGLGGATKLAKGVGTLIPGVAKAGEVIKGTKALKPLINTAQKAGEIINPFAPVAGLGKNVAQGALYSAETGASEALKKGQEVGSDQFANDAIGGAIGSAAIYGIGKGIGQIVKGTAAKKIKGLKEDTIKSTEGNAQDLNSELDNLIKTGNPEKQILEGVAEIPKETTVPKTTTVEPELSVKAKLVEAPEFKSTEIKTTPIDLSASKSSSRETLELNKILDEVNPEGQSYRDIIDPNNAQYSSETKNEILKSLQSKAKQQASMINKERESYFIENVLEKENKKIANESFKVLDDLEQKKYTLQKEGKPTYEIQNEINNTQVKLSNLSGKSKGVKIDEESPAVNGQKINSLKNQKKDLDVDLNKKVKGGEDLLPNKTLKKRSFVNDEDAFLDQDLLAKAIGRTVTGVKSIAGSSLQRPLASLDKNFKSFTSEYRNSVAKLTKFANDVDNKYLRALHDNGGIPASEESKIAQILDTEASDLIRSGKLNTQEYLDLSPQGKKALIIIARYFRDAGIASGLPEGRFLSEYLPHWFTDGLRTTKTGQKSTAPAAFTFSRSSNSEFQSTDLTQLMLRYSSLTKREILTKLASPGGSIDQAIALAKEKSLTQELKALELLKNNLLKVDNPNAPERFINDTLSNYVENNLRLNISASTLNLSQPFQTLIPEAGFNTVIDAAKLLFNKETRKDVLEFLKKTNIQGTSKARFELQENLAQGLPGEKALADYSKKLDDPNFDLFSNIESELNQPLAVLSGMLKRVGSKEQLINLIKRFNEHSKSGQRNDAMDSAMTNLIAEGQKMNEKVNFVPLQANRAGFESMGTASKMFLTFLNYPIREAALVGTWAKEGLSGDPEAFRKLSYYLVTKIALTGSEAARMFIPASVAREWRRNDPQGYKTFQDSIEVLDEYGNFPGKAGFSLQSSVGGPDITATGKNFDSTNPLVLTKAPFLRSLSKIPEDFGTVLNQEEGLGKRIKSGANLLSLTKPLPAIKGIQAGYGELGELASSAVNIKKGSKDFMGETIPTSLKDEAKRQFAPLKQDVAIIRRNRAQEESKELFNKGVSPTQRALKTFKEASGSKDSLNEIEDDKLLSLGKQKRKELMEDLYMSWKGKDIQQAIKTREELTKLGVTRREIEKGLERKEKQESGRIGEKAADNKKKKLRSIREGYLK